MSAKGCEDHERHCRRKLYRRVFACLVFLVILVLFVVLVVWLVLRPTKPRFYLQDTTIYQLNLSDPSLLTSTFQITVSSRNPNDKIGIYYDELDAFALYQNQQITTATSLPTGYQGHNGVTVWSPYLYGAAVPVAQYVAAALGQDQTAGFMLLYIKVTGKLRWKVGSWISGHYNIDVSCPAFFTVGKGKGGFQFQRISSCSVDV